MSTPYPVKRTDQPERSCVVCRKRAAKEELLRFVLHDGAVVWDRDYRAAGRGAYVHRTVQCCGRLAEPRIWEFAFRVKRPQLQISKLQETAEQVLREVTQVQ